MDISIVVPFLNEGRCINELLRNIAFYMRQYKYECIIVNDFSNRQNADILFNAISYYQNIKLINNNKRLGQHKSICEGVKHTSGDYILVISADLQEEYSVLPLMIDKCITHNLVYGERLIRHDKNIFSDVANWLIHKYICSLYPRQGFDFYIFNSQFKNLLCAPKFTFPQLTLIKHIHDISSVSYTRKKRKYNHSRWKFKEKLSLFIKIFYYYK